MNTKLQMTDIMERLKQKPQRKNPAENPALTFRAVLQAMYSLDCPANTLNAVYDLRREHFEEVKIPQNSVASDNLMYEDEIARFERLCKVLFDSQDDATAAAILQTLAKVMGHMINNGLIDDTIEQISKGERPEALNFQKHSASFSKKMLIFGYRAHDIAVYAGEYLDYDLLAELCAQEIRLSDPSAAKQIAKHTLTILRAEWPANNADRYMERSRFISSYNNRSKFYSLCREAMGHFAGSPFVAGNFFALPYSDKRAHVIQTEWSENMCFTKIADDGETDDKKKIPPARNVMDDIENILHGSDYKKRLGIEEKKNKESAGGSETVTSLSVSGYIAMLVARFLGFTDSSRRYVYEGIIGMNIPQKAGKEIVNQSFLLAEQLGMETEDDEKITLQTKQFILTNIAQEFMRWGMYEYLHSGAMAAAKSAKDDEPEKISADAARYVDSCYEELLAENEKLRKELEKKEDSGSAKKMVSKEEVKELRAELSEKDKKLEELKGELESIKQENDNLYDLFDLENDAQEPLPTLSDESEVERALESKRILVWGCRPDFGRKWEGRYSNLVISVTNGRKTEKLTQTQLANYDGVIIQTNYCSHGMYEGAKNAIQNAHLPYVHIRKYDNNDAVFIQSIIKVCQMVDEREALKEGDQS